MKTLVGGLYGVDLGHVFCGESMFSLVSNASKVAFIALVNHLKKKIINCSIAKFTTRISSLG
jgi:leucyl/phenylalanyl-tRNA--protein transferase